MQKYEVGDYDTALTYFQKALTLNPKNTAVLIDMGILYEDYKKNPSKAIEMYQAFLMAHPKGDKADMVQGWLEKLAARSNTEISLPVVSSPDQGAILEVSSKTIEENKKLMKQLDLIKNALKEDRALFQVEKKKYLNKIEALSQDLTQSKKEITSLKNQFQKDKKEIKRSESKDLTEIQAKLKQTEVLWEQDKVTHKKEVEALKGRIRALTNQIEISSKEGKEVQSAYANLETQINQLQAERDRLKEAFNTATQERARLNKKIQEKEETIGALKGQVAKGAQKQSFDLSERKAFERQIALLKQKNTILEEDRKKYIQILKSTEQQRNQKSFSAQNLPLKEALPAIKKPQAPKNASRDYELVTYHRVKRGETLMMIAGYSHIYGDRSKWKIIYEANKTNIDDPNVLVPGQILLVPR